MRYLTVTLNPAFDLVGKASSLILGEVNNIQTQAIIPAGKGINVANILKSLNCNVTATGFLGNENYEAFNTFFKQKNIIQNFIKVPGKTRTNVKITVNQETTDLNFSGFTVSQEQWDKFKLISQSWAQNFDYIIISGSLPQGINSNMFNQWCNDLTSQGLKIALDTSGDALQQIISCKPFLIKPNQQELRSLKQYLQKYSHFSLKNDLALAHYLCSTGISQVLLSCGAEGAYLIERNDKQIIHTQVKCNDIVSTTGAGDSLLAAYLASLNSHSKIEALKFATALSSLVVENTSVHWDKNKLNYRLNNVYCELSKNNS